MQLTKGAIGNLINRYKAVLKKCHLMNTFGSLAVAGMLIMGGAGMATAADDRALGGGSLEWSGDADHLMGGNLYKGNVTAPEVTTPGDISLSIKGGTIEEIIGGSYVSGNNDQVENVTLGNISTTIQNGSSTEFVVGGSKISNDADATLATGKTSLTINGGTFGKEGKNDGYELVMGGNYVKTGTDTKNTASAEGSRVTVNDGIFHASVVGGSVAHRYNGNNSIMVEDNGSTSVVIKGGTFSPSQSNIADNNGGINLTAAVIGGGLAYGGGSSVLGSRDNPVTSSVTINGGTFKPEANGHYAKIVAGSVVANNGGTAIVHGNTTLAMAGGTAHDDLIGGGMVENAADLSKDNTSPKENTSKYNLNITGDSSVTVTGGGTALGEVIGGNYVKTSNASLENSAKVANSSVTITGGTFANVGDSASKAQYIIGGSKTNASGTGNATTLVEGNSSVLIDGDVTIEDGALIGGSQAKAGNGQSEATAIVRGNSSVTVNNGNLAGVIGGGIAETYYTTAIAKSTVDGTSFVTINGGNVTGNSIETGAVQNNTGKLSAAVVGGGLANDEGSAATVGSTRVTIANGTINGKVVAGGAAVNGGSSTVTHDTSLTMTGGKVDGDLIGGGFVDSSVDSSAGTANNKANVDGSTYITVSGGSLVDAEIIGGGSVRNANGTANVAGDTHVTVTKYANDQVDQEWVQYVLGGGKAMTNGTQTATAKVAGSTNVTIGEQGATGEALKIEFGTVAGGGLARAQAASSTATANVNNANVTVHSGILSGVAGGGIAESYNTGTATATVTNANLTINGGTINGVQYKDVDTNKVKVAVLGGGIAKGTKATANATTTNTVINGGSIAGHVVAGGLADGGIATVGTANLTIKGGEINGSVYAGGAALNGTADVTSFDVRITGGTITDDVVADNYTGEPSATKLALLTSTPKSPAGKGGTITIGGDATIGGKVDASAEGVATNVIIDGADAEVTGGYEGNKDSTLTFNNYDAKFDKTAYGFGTLNVAEGSNVRMDAVVSGKQGTAQGDPKTGFFGARPNAEGSSNPITITGGGTITAKQFHVSTNANVTIAHGNVVADDVQVQSATLKVGGESTSASLTVNEKLIIDDKHEGNQNIDVENLGTLTLGKNIVLDENGELKTEDLNTVPTHVKAGGTLKVNGLDGKTLTNEELAALKGLLNSNISDIPPGEGLLDLGGADLGEAVTPDPDGTVSYDKVQGITTNSLKDKTVQVTKDQNEKGISGGFKAVQLAEGSELNAKGTLVLAGSQNGDNLVIDTEGAVADLRVGGAYATRDTSAVTLGLADANNSGTVGTVTLNAGTDNKATLNVIGAGAAEFKVDDIRANESTNTINVAGATLKTGNITTESGTKALDKLNITSGIVNASGNVNITDVALANGVLTANKVPATAEGVPATGDITLGTLSGQGAVVADKTLTLQKAYTGKEGDDLTLQANELTTAAFDSTKGDVAISAATWTSGTTTLKGDTVVLTEAGTFRGAFAMDGGTLVAQSGDDANLATLTFNDNATFTNGAVAVVDSIVMADTTGTTGTDKTLTVGTGDDKVGGTTLSAKHIDLNGGMLLVDPAWESPTSSNVAVESMGTDPTADDVIVNGSVGVGQNSYLALGTADTGWLPGVVRNYTKGVGLSQDGITAALGVFKGIEIADGKGLVVDGSLMNTAPATGDLTDAVTSAATNKTAKFGANSLLVVNGANIYGDKAAIKFAAASGGTLTVDKTSKLLVTDAVAGQDYTIVDNVTTVQDGTSTAIASGEIVWKTEGLSTTTDMISLGDAKFDSTGKKVTTAAVRNDAHTVFPNLSDGMANAVNDLYTGHAGAAGEPRWDYANVDSADMGVRFLSRATDNRFLGADKDAAAATIESAARIAFAGAVPQMTKMASDAGTNAVVNRLGFANPADGAQAMDAEGKIVDRNTTGFALWIAPLWQSQHGWGMDADSMDYGFNGNLGGVSLGADYTFENAIRAGITFNIGGGYAESSGGDLSSTDNRMSFWGLGAYAGWNYENFGLMADVSYTSTWNDLKQDMDSRMGMGDLEADVQASAISAGLRAEYKLETSVLDVIPHIGVRYMSLNTWGFDAESNGGTVLEGDGFHQDIWTFPVGVTFTKDFTLDSGWSFKPSIDFSVIPAAGDIKAKQDVAFTGLPGSYEVETQMMDYLTWQGGVGLELGNDTMSFGVNYTLQAGQHTTGHGVFGSFRYEF